MNKVNEFFNKVSADDTLKKELESILENDKAHVFEGISEFASKLGFELSVDEIKSEMSKPQGELSDEKLDDVSAGFHYIDWITSFFK